MENFDATPLHLHDTRKNLGNADAEFGYISYKHKSYTAKLKHHIKQLSDMIQKAMLWVTFLYMPIFAMLLLLRITTFISIFSLYYFVSYAIIILALIMMNREERTSR